MGTFLPLFIFFTFVRFVAAQDPRFIGQIPSQCGEDATFCLHYCQSVHPGTIQARCGRDKASCICTNGQGSIGVRFVPERQPLPFTTTTTTTTTTTEQPATFDYPPDGPVPVMLQCDASEYNNAICYDFCKTDVGAVDGGSCDVIDKTCLCRGVSPAIVSPAPIPAIFSKEVIEAVEEPETTTVMPTEAPSSFWTPITFGHPNYQQNANNYLYPGYFFPPIPQQQQQQYQYQFPMFQQFPPQQFPTGQQPQLPPQTLEQQQFPQQFPAGQQQQFQPQSQQQQFPLPQGQLFPPQQQQQFPLPQQYPMMWDPNYMSQFTASVPDVSLEQPQTLRQEGEMTPEGQAQLPLIPGQGQGQLPQSPEEEGMSTVTETVTSVSMQEETTSPTEKITEGMENHRQKRSSAPACTLTTCQESCVSNGPNCFPRCVDDECLCICKPAFTLSGLPPPPPSIDITEETLTNPLTGEKTGLIQTVSSSLEGIDPDSGATFHKTFTSSSGSNTFGGTDITGSSSSFSGSSSFSSGSGNINPAEIGMNIKDTLMKNPAFVAMSNLGQKVTSSFANFEGGDFFKKPAGLGDNFADMFKKPPSLF